MVDAYLNKSVDGNGLYRLCQPDVVSLWPTENTHEMNRILKHKNRKVRNMYLDQHDSRAQACAFVLRTILMARLLLINTAAWCS